MFLSRLWKSVALMDKGAGVVTNDIFTKEDQEFLIKNEALSEPGRIKAIETGRSCSLVMLALR